MINKYLLKGLERIRLRHLNLLIFPYILIKFFQLQDFINLVIVNTSRDLNYITDNNANVLITIQRELNLFPLLIMLVFILSSDKYGNLNSYMIYQKTIGNIIYRIKRWIANYKKYHRSPS